MSTLEELLPLTHAEQSTIPQLSPKPGPALDVAIAALRAGKMIVMVDDEDRENEGDIMLAAEHVTPEAINFLVTHARGLVCLSLEAARLSRLKLPMMVRKNTASLGTAFTVSIDARHGVSTGISAPDRARTIQAAIAEDAGPEDLVSPGHIFPLRAVPGGVLERAGHTEGSLDILRLAGLKPAAVICEIMSADGTMARLPELCVFGEQHGLPIISIAELVRYRTILAEAGEQAPSPAASDSLEQISSARLPSVFGQPRDFTVHAFRDSRDGLEHLAIVKGDLAAAGRPIVRVHSECLTGDALGSLRCDCGAQLQTSLRRISASPVGVLVYLRGHEGRGIGLVNKIRAYALQDGGLDTVDANHQLGFATDERDWSVAAAVLRHLGIDSLDLLTNNPDKITGLLANGIKIVHRVPLQVPSNPHNEAYLDVKRTRMGHDFRAPPTVTPQGEQDRRTAPRR
jgi:3,4-dihydroxy 2-butanone 4-phosphate synthase/GTP cyclohydrolase II